MTATIAVVADTHCNSMLGLCPPSGIYLDEGAEYRGTKGQRWLWNNWLDFWDRVEKKKKDKLYVVLNGDLMDSPRFASTQIISANPAVIHEVGRQVFAEVLRQKPHRIFAVRGTPAHVGTSAHYEEILARDFLHAEKDPETGKSSWWHLMMEVEGVLFDIAHHGPGGKQPWTHGGHVNRLAVGVLYEAASRDFRVPDVVLRSHRHKFSDTGLTHPVRAMMTPCWQLKTDFAHKVVPEDYPAIGGLIFQVNKGQYDVETVFYKPEPRPIWSDSRKRTG